MYIYTLRLLRVIDGDTVEAEIDLGFHLSIRTAIRVYGVNCPEMHGPTRDAGKAAKDFTDNWMNQDCEYRVKTEKPDKYGRCLGAIMRTRGNQTEILGQALIDNKHAIAYMAKSTDFTEQVIP